MLGHYIGHTQKFDNWENSGLGVIHHLNPVTITTPTFTKLRLIGQSLRTRTAKIA